MKILGTPLLIEWTKFQPGTSFFIPCLDRREVERFVVKEAQRIGVSVITRRVIENKIYGLRVWRVDDNIPSHSVPR